MLQPMGLRRLDTIEQLNKENSEGHDNGDLIHFDLKSWSKLGWHQSALNSIHLEFALFTKVTMVKIVNPLKATLSCDISLLFLF